MLAITLHLQIHLLEDKLSRKAFHLPLYHRCPHSKSIMRLVVGSPFQVFTSPGYPFSSNFAAQGTGLSVCTFGMPATFAVSIRDMYFASKSLSGFLVEFIAIGKNRSFETPTVLSCRNSKTASNICNFSYNCESKYFRIYPQKARIPGLLGEYYETTPFKDYLHPSAIQGFSRVEYVPNFEDEAFLPFMLSERLGLAPNKTFGSQFFSVRWSGLIQSQFSKVHTFQCSSTPAASFFSPFPLQVQWASVSTAIFMRIRFKVQVFHQGSL